MKRDDVSSILADAVKAVEDAKVPSDLRAVAFERTLDLLVGGVRPAPLMPAAPIGAVAASTGQAAVAAGELMPRLAERLHVEQDLLETVYTEHEGKLVITLPHGKLSKSKSTGAREIGLLVCAAEQAASDDATSTESIRKVAEEYDRYDQPNFASALGELKGQAIISGAARLRTYKLTKPGWSEVAKLVTRLTAVKAE
jgi:hypothetical protein